MSQLRHPAGIPSGGQYAPTLHAESPSHLSGDDRLSRLLAAYPELQAVSEALSRSGAHCYIVGGTMRDLSSGQTPHDLDITSPLRPEQFHSAVENLDAAVYDIGEVHGTTGLRFTRPDGEQVVVEHTTHRTESYEPGGRTPMVTMGDSLEDDLARRDFTINAVAMDLETGEVVDPFDGGHDLESHLLRTPTDPERTLSEDPLRISRLVRFAVTRHLEIDPDTAEAAARCANRLSLVSAERKYSELSKIFAAGPDATADGLVCSHELGQSVVDQVWCGLGDDADPAQVRRFVTNDPTCIAAGLALRSSEPRKALRALKFTNHDTAAITSVLHAVDQFASAQRECDVRTALRRHGALACDRAVIVSTGLDSAEHRERIAGWLEANRGFDTRPLPVDGNDLSDLGLRGRDIGVGLAAVERAMCNDPSLTRGQALAIASGGAHPAPAHTA